MKSDAQEHGHSRWGLMAIGAAFGWLMHKAFSQKVVVPDASAPGIATPAPTSQVGVVRPQAQDEPVSVSGSEFLEEPAADHVAIGTILVVAAFAVGIGGAIGFLFAYWTGNNNLLLGGTMALSFGGVGTGLVLWARWLIPHPEVTGSREVLPSSPEERQAVLDDFCKGENRIQRRRLLTSLSTAFVGVMAAVMVSLLRSFGKPPGPALMDTVWKSGQRLLTMHGEPISVDTLEEGSSVIVFPEESIGTVNGQTVLIRVKEESLRLPKERAHWAPMGYVAYSRVCTHAGCPVGIFEAENNLLLCPCHQSTFDVLRAAKPTGGPAARPLPQLPLYVDADGHLRAGGGFTEPPGPGFWGMP